MIVFDIETTGLDFVKTGIWQIGAIDLESGEEFLQEAKIDDEDKTTSHALNAHGKIEQELRKTSKQSQKQMIENFLNWLENKKIKNFICQNPQFDVAFILTKIRKYNLDINFNFRAFDLHSIAQTKYFEVNKKFAIDYEKQKSSFDLTKILEFCGLKDERENHNALEDCRLTAECFYRLIHGKNLFNEFEEFKIPDYLL